MPSLNNLAVVKLLIIYLFCDIRSALLYRQIKADAYSVLDKLEQFYLFWWIRLRVCDHVKFSFHDLCSLLCSVAWIFCVVMIICET